MFSVETIPLIDKYCGVLAFVIRAPERGLTPVDVACPLVHRQHAREHIDIPNTA